MCLPCACESCNNRFVFLGCCRGSRVLYPSNRTAAQRSLDRIRWDLCPAAQSRERPTTLAVPESRCDCDTNTSRSAAPESGKQTFCLVRFLHNSNRARHPSPPEYAYRASESKSRPEGDLSRRSSPSLPHATSVSDPVKFHLF